MPVERLRWITFGHLESDECGAMNQFLAAAPERAGRARRARLHGVDQRPRRPTARAARARRGARPRRQARPQHRHAARAPRLGRARRSTRRPPARCSAATCFSQVGDGPALTGDDVVDAAAQAEDMFGATCLTPQTGADDPRARRARSRRRSRSCTARRSRATARRRCSPWPTTTTGGSRRPGSDDLRRRARPLGARRDRPRGHVLRRRVARRARSRDEGLLDGLLRLPRLGAAGCRRCGGRDRCLLQLRAPAMVERAIPDACSFATPESLVRPDRGRPWPRARGVPRRSTRLHPQVVGMLRDAVTSAADDPTRPLYRANREVARPTTRWPRSGSTARHPRAPRRRPRDRASACPARRL